MLKLIDTHNHLGCDAFNNDRDQVITNSYSLGIDRHISIATNYQERDLLKQLTNQYPSLYYAFGFHPLFLPPKTIIESQLNDLQCFYTKELSYKKLCALGEIGLDYHLSEFDKPYQQYCFIQQLNIASTLECPVLLHIVRAHADAYLLLKQQNFTQGGIVHAFTGSIEEANNYIKLGFKIGLGGLGTYPQNHKIHKMIQALPLNAIVLETDAPDLPDITHRGQRNSPEYLIDICHLLAKIKGVPPHSLAISATQNTCELFNWDITQL